MMQSCASAAKLRSGGPILPFGLKPKGSPRDLSGFRHLEPLSASRHERTGRNCRGAFNVLRSLYGTQNNAVWDNALPHEPPQGDQ
jgi:hypothetical protein